MGVPCEDTSLLYAPFRIETRTRPDLLKKLRPGNPSYCRGLIRIRLRFFPGKPDQYRAYFVFHDARAYKGIPVWRDLFNMRRGNSELKGKSTLRRVDIRFVSSGMPAYAVRPGQRPRLFCMTSALEQKPSVAAEEKEREPPMERRRLPVYKRFRHRAEHVVLLIHEYYFFFRSIGHTHTYYDVVSYHYFSYEKKRGLNRASVDVVYSAREAARLN